MKKIYKYQIEINRLSTIKMPMEARILSVQMQKDNLCLWAEVDAKHDASGVRTFVFSVVATGEQYPSEFAEYIASVQEGPYVWHVFKKQLIY